MPYKDIEVRRRYNRRKTAEWRAANAEKAKAQSAASYAVWYAANREAKLAATKAWKAANVDKVSARDKKRYANPERKKAIRAAVTRWVARNPEKVVMYWRDRRARKEANGGRLSRGIVGKLMKLQRGCCAVCREKLVKHHLDHIVPLNAGGANSDENVQLLCPFCNLSKGHRDPVEFMQSLGRLL
jgi:5-methylcytosine-specific restriction endonuclease McrA